MGAEVLVRRLQSDSWGYRGWGEKAFFKEGFTNSHLSWALTYK
jgi:hypothetical protein